MNKIEVEVLDQHDDPGGMMMFLARLTQRGHQIKTMADLDALYQAAAHPNPEVVRRVSKLPHGTIKRFTPITIAVVGASRRFLAQARTHQVGMTFVSASLQYSDYSDDSSFVVPYELFNSRLATKTYLQSCRESMATYKALVDSGFSNDSAGYAAPQGLRNILIIQANHEAWMHFIRTRACKRNTVETQYVTMRIWEKLLETYSGREMFAWAGPDCIFGSCREGKMSCGNPMGAVSPKLYTEETWPEVL